jgi:hypothetical protein
MKRTLLSLALMVSAFILNAQAPQPLPLTENFNDGTPAENWLTSVNPNALSIEPYSANNAAGDQCVPNSFGLVLNPGVINQQNRGVFTSPALIAVDENSQVILRFRLFAYDVANNNAQGGFICDNQVPCTATVKVYIVDASYASVEIPTDAEDILGESAPIEINTTNAESFVNIFTSVTADFDGFTNFRVLFDVSDIDACANPLRFIIDDLFIDAQEEIVTPVTFKAFNASRKSSAVSLSWTTASEQNNKGFTVQRNVRGTWEDVSFIPSASNGGNSSTDLTYTFTDANNEKGISQYRVQQIDYDGKFSYSDIRAVRGAGAARIVVYPNPSPNGNTSLMFDDDNAVRDVFVSDGQGRIVKQYKQTTGNILLIDQLSKGFYTIRVVNRNTGASDVEKLVVN